VKRSTTEQAMLFAALVAAGVGLRFYFQDLPNFAPVAALALFAGFYFQSHWLAALAPLSVMWITDYFLGGYQPLLMVTVYGLLTVPVLMRNWLRRRWATSLTVRAATRSLAALLCCSLTASIAFFVVTNFVTWQVTPWYPRSLSGVWQCYLSAIPFFRYTLAGDLGFAGLLFGGYAAWQLLTERATAHAYDGFPALPDPLTRG
jgi:hypothetical protein